MKQITYMSQGNNLILLIDGIVHNIGKSHLAYTKILDAIEKKEWDLVENLTDARTAVEYISNGILKLSKNDVLSYLGMELHNVLATKIITLLKQGEDVSALINFLINLMKNPSKRSVDELYGFLEKANIPITPDGYFLAYKKVNGNYLDVHSNTVLNKPANLLTPEEYNQFPMTGGKVGEVQIELINKEVVVSMPRNFVDDERDRTCSTGLHFCSLDYLSSFYGSHIIVLKINPADVVSIPSDYKQTKGRCSKYIVLEELTIAPKHAFTKIVQDKSNTADDIDDHLNDDLDDEDYEY